MCKEKNIENFENVLCALKQTYRDKKDITDNFIMMDYQQLKALPYNESNLYYGILTVGDATTCQLNLIGQKKISIIENSQIIELFHNVEAITGDEALFFRGYVVTLK